MRPGIYGEADEEGVYANLIRRLFRPQIIRTNCSGGGCYWYCHPWILEALSRRII